MKSFTHKNEGFTCCVCGAENPPASATCRNHCLKCLYSLHVDKNPGDRAESCHGRMKPIQVEVARGSMSDIVFQCEKCGVVKKNKIASDDDRETLLSVISEQ
ncbi:RNHCP domain-containing protein [Candidatus Gracilibacteria bacterium]|nr:RNHCP domain-containing protein [Candidatus Gracilibacteria bacterium]